MTSRSHRFNVKKKIKNKFKYITLLFVVIAASIGAFIVYPTYFKEPDKNFESIDEILQRHGGIDLEVVESPKSQGPFHVLRRHSSKGGKIFLGNFIESESYINPIPGYVIGVVLLEDKDGKNELLVVKYK